MQNDLDKKVTPNLIRIAEMQLKNEIFGLASFPNLLVIIIVLSQIMSRKSPL